jgi:hypothetical protein
LRSLNQFDKCDGLPAPSDRSKEGSGERRKEIFVKIFAAAVKLTGLVLVSLIVCRIAPAQLPPDNIEGNWTIYSNRIQDGAIEIKHVQIQQIGNRLEGYFEGPFQQGPIQGFVHIHHVEFHTLTNNVLTFRGQIYGDNMSGMYGLHGKHAAWQATRTSVVGLAVPQPTVPTYQYQPVQAPAPAPAYQSEPAQAPPAQAPQPAPPAPAQQAPAQDATAPSADANPDPAPALLTPEQLDSLVAPIALYPDALVAQVLAAAGYPEQVAFADYWLSQNKNLIGAALAQAVDHEPWDPSIKALTQFPSVLHDLASNMTWTSNLGQAVHDQQADVMAAVQVMRAKAQAAGSLQSTAQIAVTQPTPGTIVIQPASPEVVYVPQYNPAVIYGAPYVVPYYTPSYAVASIGLSFGAGVAIGAAIGGGGGYVGGGFGWGWGAWGCNWGGGGGTVIYNHTTYINNRGWHGGDYNHYHPWGPNPNDPNGPHHYGPGWQPNGGHNGDHGLIGGNGGVQHPPDGGHNGDHGLIGGNGGVQHPPDGGHNGDHGQIGGNGGVQHTNDPGAEQHAHTAHDGASTRAESNRGRSSMHGGGMYRAPHPHPAPVHHSAPAHSSGGGAHHR